MSFEPAAYGSVFESLLSIDRRCALDAGSPNAEIPQALTDLSVESAFGGQQVTDAMMARCCVSGVWLLHNYLDDSHTISQSIATREGSFWHGVMHRREGDYWNAKYWFRRVGEHPIYESLAEQFGEWDPFQFVDQCEAAVRESHDVPACLEAQQAEWELLFDWCFHRAVGG